MEAVRTGSSTERVRRHRAKKAAEADTVSLEFSDEEARQTGSAIQVAWSLAVVPFTGGRIRELREHEVDQLGRAFAPLVKKYLPILADWQYEITAAMVLIHVVKECYVPPPVEPQPIGQSSGVDGPPAMDGPSTPRE